SFSSSYSSDAPSRDAVPPRTFRIGPPFPAEDIRAGFDEEGRDGFQRVGSRECRRGETRAERQPHSQPSWVHGPQVLLPSRVLGGQHRRVARRCLVGADPPRRIPRGAPLRRFRGEPGHRPQHAHRPARPPGGVRLDGGRPLPGAAAASRVPADGDGKGPLRRDDGAVLVRGALAAGRRRRALPGDPRRLRQRGPRHGPLQPLRGAPHPAQRAPRAQGPRRRDIVGLSIGLCIPAPTRWNAAGAFGFVPPMPSLIIPARGPLLARRLANLMAGLVLFGTGLAMMLNARLGVPPWDVLHQGLYRQFGLTIGTWSIIVSVLVLALWIPLKERFGIGTILNAVVIGVVFDLAALVLPEPESMLWRVVMLAGGIFTVGFASGLYIGANLGPGPRDGLMTGIAKSGPPSRLPRTWLEVAVLVIGYLLGGTFGVGTVAFALFVGPMVQFFLPRRQVEVPAVRRAA